MIARSRVRQLGLGELLDEAFRIYRGGFVTFLAITALIYVPYAILNLLLGLPLNEQLQRMTALTSSGAVPDDPGFVFDMLGGMVFYLLGSLGLGLVYSVIFEPLLQGALAHTVSQSYLGRTIGVGDGFGAALRRAWPLIGSKLIATLFGSSLMLVGFVIYLVLVLVVLGQAFGSDDPTGALGLVLGASLLALGIIFAGLLVFLFVWTRLLFVPQAAALEQHGAWSSVKRSWDLTRGYFWRTLGYLIVITLLTAVVSAAPTWMITALLSLLAQDNPALQTTISTVVTSLMAIIVTPFTLIAFTLMYYDLRVRKEAFDLEQRADRILPPGTNYELPGAF